MFNKSDDKKLSNFERYRDPTGEFSNRSLKLSEWYIAHKILLRNIFIGVMLTWSVVTISIGLFVWGKYLLFDYNKDNAMLNQIATSQVTHGTVVQKFSPQALAIGSTRTLEGAGDKYDFVSTATNNNDDWIAIPQFRFVHARGATSIGHVTILPGMTAPLALFGEDIGSKPASVRLEMVGVDWKRVDAHEYPDPLTYIAQRLQFTIDNVEFTPARESSGADTHMIAFDITNDSLFSYWEGTFVIVYKSGGQVTGYAPLTVEQFLAGETRHIELASFVDRLNVTDIELMPLINVFDQEVYMPLR